MEETKIVRTKKIKTIIQAEEEHLSSVSTKKVTRKKSSKSSIESITSDVKIDPPCDSETGAIETESMENSKKSNGTKKTKSKTKKQKMAETDTQNISVKKSFSKFDELQKKNLIHVRSSDGGNAKKKFTNPQDEKDNNCNICAKPVYKMEEVKAQKKIFHKNCFRCKECNKLLKVDNYQCHEGVLYCLNHFKMLFAPKVNPEDDNPKPRKAELIILENEPEELPPDVVRASNKPDLGLEELQQLNVRSRFEIFENGNFKKEDLEKSEEIKRTPVEMKASIVAKLAKLQQHGCFVGENLEAVRGTENGEDSSEEELEVSDSDVDIDLVRSKKCTEKERPIGIGDAMNDIKSRFETGHIMTKEERREERKQEIQNIRSRLFMGKQARIKEMYQQAVADAENGKTTGEKSPDIAISCAAKTLKDRFEKGEMFKHNGHEDGNEENIKNGAINEDADVFESAISKKSRSIFMELDANVAANKNNNAFVKSTTSNSSKRINSETEHEENYADVVRHDTQTEDVKIETSEISQKFKFFETFRPTPVEKKQFRITPPRDGVVKLPTPDSNDEEMPEKTVPKDNILEKSQTTSKMLSMFREMEQNKLNDRNKHEGPKPLKCFTPPPDGEKRNYNDQESDLESDDDMVDENGENSDKDFNHNSYENDSSLKEAQLAARAKLLRAKFEKWQSTQEENGSDEDLQSQQVMDSSIESTKTLRERFENMNKVPEIVQSKSRCQVNRFV